jgi:branched-chain amino acid transport system permease protein
VDKFLVFTIVGLSTAAIYAIIASGLVVTYTTTGIFNFAHGATGMLAAFAYWQFTVKFGWPIWLSVVLVLLVLAPLFGMLLDRVIMRGLEGTSEATKLVVSISLLVAMIGLAQWIWEPGKARTVKPFFVGQKIDLGVTTITYHQAITIGVAILVAILLRLLLFRTRMGVAMRSVVDDRSLARLNGARTGVVSQFSWAFGTSLAALGGIHRQRLRRRRVRSPAVVADDVRGRHHHRPRRRVPVGLPAFGQPVPAGPASRRAGHPPLHRPAGHAQQAAAQPGANA